MNKRLNQAYAGRMANDALLLSGAQRLLFQAMVNVNLAATIAPERKKVIAGAILAIAEIGDGPIAQLITEIQQTIADLENTVDG